MITETTICMQLLRIPISLQTELLCFTARTFPTNNTPWKNKSVVEGICKAAVFPPQASVYTRSVWSSTANVLALHVERVQRAAEFLMMRLNSTTPACLSGTRMLQVTLTLQWSSTNISQLSIYTLCTSQQ